MQDKTCCFIIIGTIILTVTIILLAKSFDTVDPANFGLKCNTISKQCTQNPIYKAGRYYVGLTGYFIEFPAFQKTIEYSYNKGATSTPLLSRTADGITITLFISFQYQLQQDKIGDLYKMNNLKYEQTLDKIARDVILQTSGTYKGEEFWTNRQKIQQDIQHQLDLEFKKVYTNCRNLQILQLDLPQMVEDKIIDTLVEGQLQKQKELERQSLLIRKDIEILKSDNDQKIKSILSDAQGQAYLKKQTATATGLQASISAESETVQSMNTNLKLNSKQLQQYLYFTSILTKKGSQLVVGIQNAIVANNVI